MQRVALGPFFSHHLKIQLVVLISASSFFIGCSDGRKPLAETPPPPVTAEAPALLPAAPPDQPKPMPMPPQRNEVEAAVKRVFKEAVLIDTSNTPAFIVGDFNGDSSQDLAVVLKPASEKLPELNEEFPNWILRDLAGTDNQPRSPRLRVAANDKLLAIIHGYDSKGWRDEQATQTFLLKNVATPGIESYSPKEFIAAYRGHKMPQLRGDVLGQEMGGKLKCIYYSGATYSWYDPSTFDLDSERRAVHMAPRETRK
ncbi:MAG TPA: hypothetical protein VMS31_08675 [Pyrinomonadaceae bacterium]|nr:hypothetical protein [Pyrinomonadaceae bacterium]